MLELVGLVVVAAGVESCRGNGATPAATVADWAASEAAGPVAAGPLRVLRQNPRYFSDGSGKAVLLVGSHTWDNRQDIGSRPFDWTSYLARLQEYNHNFVRLWVWEQPRGVTTWPDPAEPPAAVVPELFARTRPDAPRDCGPKFDVTSYGQPHLERLRDRVVAAGNAGIYVSIMLFNGWSVAKKAGGENPWGCHPFNSRNNVNGINGDPNGDHSGEETHTLQVPAVTQAQEGYLRKIIDTVNDLDNVLYEVSNESNGDSVAWQHHVIRFVKSYESSKPKRHPVGMTVPWPEGSNKVLFDSPADWISPNSVGDGGDYRTDPPAASGAKVVLADTDHLWGIGGSPAWAWKSFTRGLNVLYMDPWEGRVIPAEANPDLRRNMGYILAFSRRMDLANMAPKPELASTGFCLAHPGRAYLVYVPGADEWLRPKRILGRAASWFLHGRADIDLSAARLLSVEWLNPRTGEITRAGTVTGGRKQRLVAPFAGAAVLYMGPTE